MKKIITMLLVGLMMFGSFGAVFAEEPVDAPVNVSLGERQHVKVFLKDELKQELMERRYSLLKEFTDEIHQINNIRIERNQLQIQVIEKQDQLLDLYIAARESGNKEALQAAKEERSKIKAIHEEIRALHEEAKATREALREAKKNNDTEAIKECIDDLIEIHTSINNKIREKVGVLESIINILS